MTNQSGRPSADLPPDEPFDDESGEEAGVAADDDIEHEGSSVEILGEAAPDRLRSGMEVIARFATTLPRKAGVYRMFDHEGDVLYVGKAKNLKARVSAYARGQAHTNRVARMISETAAMEFVTTNTETEALLLEANLIKQLRPRYNVLLRDDKSFPYILVTGEHVSPQLTKHRGAHNRKGDYYGPFANVGAVNRTINALQRAFLLRTCTDSYYENRTRPCLLFQIKRCAGPCTGEISHSAYSALVDEAKAFLSGKSSAVKKHLAAEMQQAAEALEFERAARYRDRLAALSAVQTNQDINTQSVEEADVVAIAEEAGHFCIQVFFFRNRQNWGNRAYFPKADRTLTPGEVLAAFLAQFYADKPSARLVLLSHAIEDTDVLAEALCLQSGHRVEIAVPQRGEKADLVAYAKRNAQEALARQLADTTAQTKLLAAIGQALGIEGPIRRVEVYDNSHIMGTNAVGAMIVAGPKGFMKTHYRTFNIRSDEIAPGDDFGMMRELMQRRFARLLKDAPRSTVVPSPRVRGEGQGEGLVVKGRDGGDDSASPATTPHPSPLPAGGERETTEPGAIRAEENAEADPDAFPLWPDLVLIDGGKGQLDAARGILAELGIHDVPLVGVAKGRDRDAGRETFFVAGRQPFKLPPRDPALYFIQRLRDEAHRFAIGTHRAKRKRDITKSPLDEIAGIGPARKRALLLHFGTAKAVSRASLEDLMRTPGVNAATAKIVYDHFNERR